MTRLRLLDNLTHFKNGEISSIDMLKAVNEFEHSCVHEINLNRTLLLNEKEHLLKTLFGFSIAEGIIFDKDGNEFYAKPENLRHSFGNLQDVINYIAFDCKAKGFAECQTEMRRVLGL